MPTSSDKNLTINGLRGLLALSVVVYHGYKGMTTSQYLTESSFRQIENVGPFAVNLFFIISGYLIFQSLIRSGSVSKFIKNRILRVYPVFLTIHLLIFIAGPIIDYERIGHLSVYEYILNFIANLLMMPGIFNLPAAQIVAWSLSYEFAFYLVISVFYFGSRAESKIPKYICLGVVLITSFFLIYEYPVMLFFVVGIILYLYVEKIVTFLRYRYQKWFYFNGVIFLLLSFLVYDPSNISLSLIFSFFFFFAVIHEEGAFSRFMRSRLFQYLGNISYSLYLWHTLIMFPIKRLIPILELESLNQYVLFATFTGVSLIISILISHCSYRLLEVKAVKVLKNLRIFNSRKTEIAAPAR